MSAPPGGADGYEVMVRAGRRHVMIAGLRAAGRESALRIRRLRRWITTPRGRRALAAGARGVLLVAFLAGGFTLARRWADRVRDLGTTVAYTYRAVTEAIGTSVRTARFIVSLRWLSVLLSWFSRNGAGGQGARHVHCPECHARIRADARVCRRCGHRDPLDRRAGAWARRRHLVVVGWLSRAVTLRLYHRCPDCRSILHADARVCRACGCRVG